VLRRCVWPRNIKNGCSIYIYDISRLRVNEIYCNCIRITFNGIREKITITAATTTTTTTIIIIVIIFTTTATTTTTTTRH